jgi:hypothetical protein
MNPANTATYDARSRQTAIPAIAAIPARAAAAPPTLIRVRACSPSHTGCTMSPTFESLASRQVREEGEYYIPDRLNEEDDEADPALAEAAWAYTGKVRDAQRRLDDAINLAGVLLDALEQDADSRAAQSRTVLEIAVECLHKAHSSIDEQEGCDRNLFLAHFEGRGAEPETGEDGPPMDD